MTNNQEKSIIVGKLTKAHGVKGLVKVTSFMQNPADLFEVSLFYLDGSNNEQPIKLRICNKLGIESFICQINDISSRGDAEKLQGYELHMHKTDLPETETNEAYVCDLVGSTVVEHESTTILGKVKDVYNFGGGDIIEIEFSDGKTQMYPYQDKIFPHFDRQNSTLHFIPIEFK